MHARVATFEGADSSELRKTIDAIREESAKGPPEGLSATGFLMLIDEQAGKTLAESLFATEEDMREGDKVLNVMQPPVTGGMGRRTSVEMYEVAVGMRVALPAPASGAVAWTCRVVRLFAQLPAKRTLVETALTDDVVGPRRDEPAEGDGPR